MLFPGSETEDTSVNNISGWRAYSPSKAARGVSSNPVLNSRYGSHLVAANSNASGPPVVSSGCEITFQEGCDNGSNYTALDSTAGNYTAGADFSTGIKTSYLKEVTCTAGTQIKYKVEWANQAAGSKETWLYGMAMNY